MGCSCLEEGFVGTLPEGAVVLATGTAECCIVYRVGDEVTKCLKRWVQLNQIQERLAITKLHPDLFVPFFYNSDVHVIVQPFIDGPKATSKESDDVITELLNRGENRIHDIGPQNIIMKADGKPAIIDFGVILGVEVPKFGMMQKGHKLTVVGGLTSKQMARLNWKPTNRPQ